MKSFHNSFHSAVILTLLANDCQESLKYRLLGSEGSSSSSASSSSSDSGSDDNEDDDDMKDEDGAASDSDEEKMMVSWSPTVDVDVDFDEEDVVVGPIRSKNEIQVIEPEKLDSLGDEIPIEKIVEKITLVEDSPSVEVIVNEDKDEKEDDSESESESESSESESSSSSSASSSSSDSGSDDNEDDDDMKDEDGAASDSDEEKMMVSWSPTVDVDFDEEDVVVGPIRSKNEIQNLPPVPPVDVTLEPHHKMVPIGVVMSTLGAQVIVEGVEKHEPLNEGSILWLTESRKPLGLVDEIFGPVKNPYYIVRYNSESEVPAGIQGGTTLVSCVPEFADRVLNNKDLYRKGYDASGANDEELSDEVEFSDDEKEAEYRKMQKMTKRGVNDQNPGKRKNNKKKFSPRDNRLPTIPNAPAAAQHVLHTVSHAPAAAPLVNHGSHSPFLGIGQGGTTTVSQFQPLNAGPNFAANGMWTNQTIFQQQPQPSQFPNAFPSNAMSYYPQNTQFSQFPVPGNPFQQQMNPSHGTQFPTMMPGVQPNIFAQQPMYAPGFVGQNQMPFDSRPPFQQIQQPPIFQTQQQGFSPNELQQRPIFQAQQQGFPPAELQSERNLNLRPSSNSSNPSQFHPGSSGSRGRPTFRGAGRRGWRPAR